VLYDIICRRIANPEIRWLTRAVLFHDPTAYYRFRSLRRREPPPGHPRYPVPARKSLFGKDNRCGLPIGNLTSQFWANVYLNELDQFAKRALRCRWYVRYVDDCVLLSADPDELWGWRDRIASFLSERLALRLRDPHERPQPLAGGIDFVGWHTWWNRRIPRRQTLANLRRRLGRFERHRTAVAFTGLARRIDLAPAASAALHATLASYSGHLRHGAAWQDWQREWMQRPWLDLLFARDGWMVHARWLHLRDRRVATAYGALLRAVPPGCLLFAPVGRFIETYGPQRLLAERVLRLRRVRLRGRPQRAGVPRLGRGRRRRRCPLPAHLRLDSGTGHPGAGFRRLGEAGPAVPSPQGRGRYRRPGVRPRRTFLPGRTACGIDRSAAGAPPAGSPDSSAPPRHAR